MLMEILQGHFGPNFRAVKHVSQFSDEVHRLDPDWARIEDVWRAAGVSPGGDIFIHGGPRLPRDIGRADWTAGCIAVSDSEMEIIYQMVPNGIPIWILP